MARNPLEQGDTGSDSLNREFNRSLVIEFGTSRASVASRAGVSSQASAGAVASVASVGTVASRASRASQVSAGSAGTSASLPAIGSRAAVSSQASVESLRTLAQGRLPHRAHSHHEQPLNHGQALHLKDPLQVWQARLKAQQGQALAQLPGMSLLQAWRLMPHAHHRAQLPHVQQSRLRAKSTRSTG